MFHFETTCFSFRSQKNLSFHFYERPSHVFDVIVIKVKIGYTQSYPSSLCAEIKVGITCMFHLLPTSGILFWKQLHSTPVIQNSPTFQRMAEQYIGLTEIRQWSKLTSLHECLQSISQNLNVYISGRYIYRVSEDTNLLFPTFL